MPNRYTDIRCAQRMLRAVPSHRDHPMAGKIYNILKAWKQNGKTYAEIARHLNVMEIPTISGSLWTTSILSDYVHSNGLSRTLSGDRFYPTLRLLILECLKAAFPRGSQVTAGLLTTRLQLREEPRRAFHLSTITQAGVARVEAILMRMAEDEDLSMVRPGVYRIPTEWVQNPRFTEDGSIVFAGVERKSRR